MNAVPADVVGLVAIAEIVMAGTADVMQGKERRAVRPASSLRRSVVGLDVGVVLRLRRWILSLGSAFSVTSSRKDAGRGTTLRIWL